MPYYPESSGDRVFFSNSTQEEKIVSKYTLLNFNEVYELDVDIYWRYLRDAVIWGYSQTEKGREYLEKAYYFQENKGVDKADRKGLLNFVNG